jgi:hypothetical protein
MGNDSELNIVIKAKNEASRILNQVSDDAKGMGSKLSGALSAAVPGATAIAGATVAAGAAAVAFGVQSIGAFNAATEASAKLRTNLLNVKGATMEQVTGLEALASQLQAVGVIEDDVIKAGMSQLATFNLQGSTIAALTPKITDMVAQLKGHNATAEDMVGINNLVGKVMTGNVGALSRYGVTLSDNQKKMLENGNEAQRAAVLNEVLAQNYGKVNEELAKTPEGQITMLKNAFGDLQEGVGEFIMTALTPLIGWFTGLVKEIGEAGGIMDWLKQKFEENRAVFIALAGVIGTALVIAAGAGAVALWGLMAPLLPFIAAGAAIALLLDQLAQSMGGWGNMIGAVKKTLTDMWNVLSATLGPSLQALWNTITTQLVPALQNLWNTLEPVLMPVLKTLAIILGGTIVASIWVFINVLNVAIQVVSGMVNFFANTVFPVITGVFQWIGEKVMWLKDNFWTAIGLIIGFFATLPVKLPLYVYNAINAIISWIMNINWGNVFGAIGRAFGSMWDWVKNAGMNAFNYLASINWGQLLTNVGKGFGNSIVGLLEGAINGALNGLPGNPKVKLPRFANGVENFSGGAAIVGERGPELVYLPRGSNVMTNKDTMRAMNGGTNNFYGNITLGDKGAVDRFFERLDSQAADATLGAAI